MRRETLYAGGGVVLVAVACFLAARCDKASDAAVVERKQALAAADSVVQEAKVRVDTARRVARVAVDDGRRAARIAVAHRDSIELPRLVAALPDSLYRIGEQLVLDSVAIARLEIAVTAQDTLIERQRNQIVADSVARNAAGNLIQTLQHEQHPRCGRNCGMVLGVVGAVAVGVLIR